MRKGDLKTGMLVQTRNGDWHVAMVDTEPQFYGGTSLLLDMSDSRHLELDDYCDTLQFEVGERKFDIVGVATVAYAGDILMAFRNKSIVQNIPGFKIIWGRQEDSTEELQAITEE